MTDPEHLSLDELRAGLDRIRRAPVDSGPLEMIVRRPHTGERELPEQAELDPIEGLRGDNWSTRGSRHTSDGGAHPEMQLTVVCSRAIDLVAGSRARWAAAGDQLYVDMDLSAANMPPGTRLTLGSAIVEVTATPHTGCKKFVQRYGVDALRLFNSPEGRFLNLRGINSRVIRGGRIRVGDTVTRRPAGTG